MIVVLTVLYGRVLSTRIMIHVLAIVLTVSVQSRSPGESEIDAHLSLRHSLGRRPEFPFVASSLQRYDVEENLSPAGE